MSELRLAYPVCVLVDKREITAADIELLRNRVFRSGSGGRDDVAILLALHHSAASKCPEWEPFFRDQMVSKVLARISSLGAAQGVVEDWVRHTFCRGGVIASRAEFRVVVEVVEALGASCPELAVFALEQIHLAVAEGEGPLASRRSSPWVSMTGENLENANRILAALGASEPLSLPEAEALFDPVHNLSGQYRRTAFDDLIADLCGPQKAAA
jgi:hypothetical protein